MARYLVIHGPNLNRLGKRDPALYGTQTLEDIDSMVAERAGEIGVKVSFCQGNTEGVLIDYLQAEAGSADGVIINPGAFGHYSYAIHDALLDTGKPIAEVHISNVFSREEWRHKSVISPIARGVISGFGWRGYVAALELLVALDKEQS